MFEAYRNRQRWQRLPHGPEFGFQDDMENGLSSNQFDLNKNIVNNDTRTLDDAAKGEIRRMMSQENITFDEARLKYFQCKLSEHGIGADGVPRDPKAVMF
ncbi:hypothetical protein METBIDRAFT_32506 [Metschnikowia bicuspidata var. bicuspidata NRRL YB-4993]|uniref:Uncharacterized protein n=1 Tax=Metschnikowia bicuspidata var. bicuspidata NRRL YB-4993 TaxID=869754 RepID=A0A1A0H9E8_9ASCO|nr:hypothetical protein METBIDRAFT_32506 [Metschnikowia bicuspidata var. bicuspidata NRRL YB-4993]OBA20512.1 hypothetical protein METBIDRAFT_32506 [Metschnikowia bicuspidata var. bicuspidata NRRL YB-4993]